jgi:threonine dehydrogenase-like Zn-dependent dehydrogenase
MSRYSDQHHEHQDHDKMRTVLREGKPSHMTVASVPKPKIEYPTDAILRITTAAICGTDLHTFHGKFGSPTPPWPMGHEAIGVVIEIGKAVKTVKVGQKFVVPDLPDDGHLNLTVPTIGELAGFGFGPLLGNLGGCQGTPCSHFSAPYHHY